MKNRTTGKRVGRGCLDFAPVVYHAESLVNCGMEKAWKIMLNYEAWNPTFVDAVVTPVRGRYRSEGELVLIKKAPSNGNGGELPPFYAKTVKVTRHAHVVWYVYPRDENPSYNFRNFVDFGLTETGSGVKFNVFYYAQVSSSGESLAKEKKEYGAAMREIAVAFKSYCEARA